MRRVTVAEARTLADLFRNACLTHPIELVGEPVSFSVGGIGEPFNGFDGLMQGRTMAALDGSGGVRVEGASRPLEIWVGRWSDQPDNEQLVLGSTRPYLDPRFAQINLNTCLTDGRTALLVKNLAVGSKEGGTGSIMRLYHHAHGPEMADERVRRKEQLVRSLGYETIRFEGEEWLVIAALPLRIPRRRANGFFTEAIVQFLRYAAQVERLRRGADLELWEYRSVHGTGALPHRLSAEERKLVELEAMAVVRERLEEQGYRVKDVASRESYDFVARLGQEVRYVEVKGTTARPWSVELTAPEHRVASQEGDRYSLWVVVFEGLDRLDEYEWYEVGNPLTSSGCSVAPVRYRVQEKE